MKKSISEKEMKFISKLELKEKYFFTRDDIKANFSTNNEMSVYLHRLKKKGRIIRLNKSKYFLIPVKAVGNNWAEHPFTLIDEIMNGKDYCIVGKAAAHYWKWIDQIPVEYEVWNTRIQRKVKIFNARLNFRKKRKLPNSVIREIYGHQFTIIKKSEAEKWK